MNQAQLNQIMYEAKENHLKQYEEIMREEWADYPPAGITEIPDDIKELIGEMTDALNDSLLKSSGRISWHGQALCEGWEIDPRQYVARTLVVFNAVLETIEEVGLRVSYLAEFLEGVSPEFKAAAVKDFYLNETAHSLFAFVIPDLVKWCVSFMQIAEELKKDGWKPVNEERTYRGVDDIPGWALKCVEQSK